MTKIDKPVKDLFNDFINQKEFQDLEVYYNQPNLIKIMKKHRSETAHSAFWAWLINPKESHNLGIVPLEMIIKSTIPEFSCNHNLSDVSVITESSIKGGRFDIFIDSNPTNTGEPFSIIIENKINASENFEQTLNYHNWSKDKNSKKANYFIYMKPYELDISGISLSVDEKGDIFKKISYQKLYDEVLLPLFSTNSDIYKKYATEYIISLSTTDTDFGHLIITNVEKMLYEGIISNYKDSLIQIINTYGQDKSIENHKKLNLFYNLLHFIRFHNTEEFTKSMKSITEILDGTRDFTKFIAFGLDNKKITEKPMPKNQLFNFILDFIIVNQYTYEELQDILPVDIGTNNIIKAYIKGNSEDDLIQKNPFKDNKKRKNPFYDFDKIITLKDCVIVPYKSWTSRQRTEFNKRGTIDVLRDYINDKKEIFKLTIEPID